MSLAGVAERREKRFVALSSVVAAIGLTAMKLVVGVLSGSLGLLAEAAHSGLDLVAALLTLFAVRLADRPPDQDHPYGHGKIENLSAFFEAGLLLVTAAWIIYEALQRLLFRNVEVEPTVWAFLVVIASMVIDFTRSRALARAATKYGSQALEADALHFRTDIWSSAVVLLGLAVLQVGRTTGQVGPWAQADAIAAILVALVVIVVGARLAKGTIDALLDRAPEEQAHRIADAAAGVPGVLECRRVRLRRAGNQYFADLIVGVPRTTTLAAAHTVADEIEAAIRATLPRTDVVVHVEPAVSDEETATEQIHYLAGQLGLRAHDVRVRQLGDQLEVDLHLEVEPNLPLERAHAIADSLERAIGETNPSVRAIFTHLEGRAPVVQRRSEVTKERRDLVESITAIADRSAGEGGCHEVHVYQEQDRQESLDLVLHCTFPERLPIEEVQKRSAAIEQALRSEITGVAGVLIHAEPRV